MKTNNYKSCSLKHGLSPDAQKLVAAVSKGRRSEAVKAEALRMILGGMKNDLAALRQSVIDSIANLPPAAAPVQAEVGSPDEFMGDMEVISPEEAQQKKDADDMFFGSTASAYNVIAGPEDFQLAIKAIRKYRNLPDGELSADLIAKLKKMFEAQDDIDALSGAMKLDDDVTREVMDIDRNERKTESIGNATVLKIARLLDPVEGPQLIAQYAGMRTQIRVAALAKYEKEYAKAQKETPAAQALRMTAVSVAEEQEAERSDPFYSLDKFLAWKKLDTGSAEERFFRAATAGMTYSQTNKILMDLGAAVPILQYHRNTMGTDIQFLPSEVRDSLANAYARNVERHVSLPNWFDTGTTKEGLRLIPKSALTSPAMATQALLELRGRWFNATGGRKDVMRFDSTTTKAKNAYYHKIQVDAAKKDGGQALAGFLAKLSGIPANVWERTIIAGAKGGSGMDASLNNLLASIDYELKTTTLPKNVQAKYFASGNLSDDWNKIVNGIKGQLLYGVGLSSKPAVNSSLRKLANAAPNDEALRHFKYQYAMDPEGAKQINVAGYGPAVASYLIAQLQDPAFKGSHLASFLGAYRKGKPVSQKKMNSAGARRQVLRDFWNLNPGRMWTLLQTGDRKMMLTVDMVRPTISLMSSEGAAAHPMEAQFAREQLAVAEKLTGDARANFMFDLDVTLGNALLQAASIGSLDVAWNGDAVAQLKRASNETTRGDVAEIREGGAPAANRFAVVHGDDILPFIDGASFISVETAKEYLRSFNMLPAELERLARDWDKYSEEVRARQINTYLNPRFGASNPGAAIAKILEHNPSIKMAMMKAGDFNPVLGKSNVYVMTPEYRRALTPGNVILKAWDRIEALNKTLTHHSKIRILIGSNSMKDVSHSKAGSVTKANPSGFVAGTSDNLSEANTDYINIHNLFLQASLAKDGTQGQIDAAFQSITDAQLKGNTGLNKFEFDLVMAQLNLALQEFNADPNAWRGMVKGSDNLALKILVDAGVDRANPIVAQEISRILEARMNSARRMKFRGSNVVNAPVGSAAHVTKGYTTKDGYVYGTAIARMNNAPEFVYRKNFASKAEAIQWAVDTVYEGNRFDLMKWGLLEDKYENPDEALARWHGMDRAAANTEIMKAMRTHEIIERPSMETGKAEWSVPGMLIFANRTPGTSLSSHPALRLGEDPGAGFGNNMMTHQDVISTAGIDYDGDKMGMYGMWFPKIEGQTPRTVFSGTNEDGDLYFPEDAGKQARIDSMSKANLYLLARQEMYDQQSDEIREASTSGSAFYEKNGMYEALVKANHAALKKLILKEGRTDLLSADGQGILVQKVLDSKDSLGAAVSNLGLIYLMYFNNGMELTPTKITVPTPKGTYNFDPKPLVWGPGVPKITGELNLRRAINLQKAFNKLVNAVVDDSKYVAMADLGFNINTVVPFELMLLGAKDSELLDLQNPANDEAKLDALYERARLIINSPVMKRVVEAQNYFRSVDVDGSGFLGPREIEELSTGKPGWNSFTQRPYTTLSKMSRAYKTGHGDTISPVVANLTDPTLQLIMHLDRVAMWTKIQGRNLKLGMNSTGGINAILKSEASQERLAKNREGKGFMKDYIRTLTETAPVFEQLSDRLSSILKQTTYDQNSVAIAFDTAGLIDDLKGIGVETSMLNDTEVSLANKLKAVQARDLEVSTEQKPHWVDKAFFSPDQINSIAGRHASLVMVKALRATAGLNSVVAHGALSDLGQPLQEILKRVPLLGELLEVRRWHIGPREAVSGEYGDPSVEYNAAEREFLESQGISASDLSWDFKAMVKEWSRRDQENDTPAVLEAWEKAFASIPATMTIGETVWTKKDILTAFGIAGIKSYGATTESRKAGNFLSLMSIEDLKLFDQAFANYRQEYGNQGHGVLDPVERLYVGGWSNALLIPRNASAAEAKRSVERAMNVPQSEVPEGEGAPVGEESPFLPVEDTEGEEAFVPGAEEAAAPIDMEAKSPVAEQNIAQRIASAINVMGMSYSEANFLEALGDVPQESKIAALYQYGEWLVKNHNDASRDTAWKNGISEGRITKDELGEWTVAGLAPNAGGRGGHAYAFKQYYSQRYDYGKMLVSRYQKKVTQTPATRTPAPVEAPAPVAKAPAEPKSDIMPEEVWIAVDSTKWGQGISEAQRALAAGDYVKAEELLRSAQRLNNELDILPFGWSEALRAEVVSFIEANETRVIDALARVAKAPVAEFKSANDPFSWHAPEMDIGLTMRGLPIINVSKYMALVKSRKAVTNAEFIEAVGATPEQAAAMREMMDNSRARVAAQEAKSPVAVAPVTSPLAPVPSAPVPAAPFTQAQELALSKYTILKQGGPYETQLLHRTTGTRLRLSNNKDGKVTAIADMDANASGMATSMPEHTDLFLDKQIRDIKTLIMEQDEAEVTPEPTPRIKTTGVTLTPEQANAETATLNWARQLPGVSRSGSVPNPAVISGYAGTGKTFTVTHILNGLRGKVSGDISFSAPTHAAAAVLTRQTDKGGYGKAVTVQSILGMRLGTDLAKFDPSKPEFTINDRKVKMPYNGLVVVDEASMVNAKLYEALLQISKARRTGLLFMGDSAQIAPIGEESGVSMAIQPEGKGAFSQLTQVMRTAESNPLLPVFTAIRNNLEVPVGSQFPQESNWRGNEGIIFSADRGYIGAQVRELLEATKSLPAAELGSFMRFITATNAQADRYNVAVRSLLGRKERMEVGDIMVGHNTVTLGKSEDPDILVQNSFYYQIADIGKAHHIDGVEVQTVNLTPLTDTNAVGSEINVPTPLGAKELEANAIAMRSEIFKMSVHDRKFAWRDYFSYLNRYPLMESIGSGRDTVKKSIGPGYAVTVHKVQGSSINYPIIDLNDIRSFGQYGDHAKTPLKALNRMAYTAMTRARFGAIVISEQAKTATKDQPKALFTGVAPTASALTPQATAEQVTSQHVDREAGKAAFQVLSPDNEYLGAMARGDTAASEGEITASTLNSIVLREYDPLSLKGNDIRSEFMRLSAAANALTLETNNFHNEIASRLGLWKRDYIEHMKVRTTTDAKGKITKDYLFDSKKTTAWTEANRQEMDYFAAVISALTENKAVAAAIKQHVSLETLSRVIDNEVKKGTTISFGVGEAGQKDFASRDIVDKMKLSDLIDIVTKSEGAKKLMDAGRIGDFTLLGVSKYVRDLAVKKQAVYERFKDVMGYIENYLPRYYGEGGILSQKVKDARDRVARILNNRSIAIPASDTLLSKVEFEYPVGGDDFGPATEAQKALIRQYDDVYRKTVGTVAPGRSVPWHTDEEFFTDMDRAHANSLIARGMTSHLNGLSLAQGEAFKADPKIVATIQKIRAVAKNYGKKADSSRAHSRILQAKTYAEAFDKYGLKPDTLNAFDLHKRYVRDVVHALTECVLLQDLATRTDYSGNPLVLIVPTEKPKGRGAISKKVLMEHARMVARYLKKPLPYLTEENVGKTLRDMITGAPNLNRYVTVKSSYDGVAEFRALPGDGEAIVKHLSLEPVKWVYGDVDYAEQLTRAVQWTKMLSVGWSIFFPLSLIESVVAGTGLVNNILRNPVKNTMEIFKAYEDMHRPGTPYSQLMIDLTGGTVDFGTGASTDEAFGMFAQDIEKMVESVRLSQGEKAAKFAKEALGWTTGQKASGLFFEKLFPAIKLWAAHRLATETAGQLGLDLHDTFDRAHVLSLVAPTINNAYGGQFWKRYAWANPRVMQKLNWTLFASNWTVSNANLGGMGVLTGQLLGNQASRTENRFIFGKNWSAMILLVMLAAPSALQAAIYGLSRVLPGEPPDEQDTPFMLFNEQGRESYIDITPLLRKSPFYTGDPTGKRRNYMRFGKQGYEIVSGWMVEPMDQFMRKLSQPARLAYEELTGKSPGSDWNLEFQGQGWAGWIKTDKEGADAFLTSRLGHVAQKFLPMSLVTYLKDPSLGLLPMIAPLSKGKSLGMATKDFTAILQAYSDDESYNFLLQNPVAKERLAALAPGLLQAAERNGYNTDKIVNTAKGTVLSHIYRKMWDAANRGDTSEMDRYARQALRVGGTIQGATRSMKNQVKNFNRPYTPEMQAAIDDAFKGTPGKDPLEGKVD